MSYEPFIIIRERVEENLILIYRLGKKNKAFTQCSEIRFSFVSIFKRLNDELLYYPNFSLVLLLNLVHLQFETAPALDNDLEFHILFSSLFDVSLYLKFTLGTNSLQAHRCLLSQCNYYI